VPKEKVLNKIAPKETASNGFVLEGSVPRGIGTDLLDQRRIAKVIDNHGERFARRILTAQELLVWAEKAHSVNFLAKRFAAKEAIAKALGTGIAQGISFQHINIYADDLGKPVVELSSAALSRAQSMGCKHVLLSLSDEGEMILAFAVLS
jgi:holo-[acyl-carrier protein] synthase